MGHGQGAEGPHPRPEEVATSAEAPRTGDAVGRDDAFDRAVDAAADVIAGRLTGAVDLVLLDGRSGSGKTTLAARVAARIPVTVLALDDVYPGWDGLDEGVAELRERVLTPRRRGLPAVWRRWDWDAAEWAESHEVPGDRPLLVEGSGILTPATAELADLTVWLDSPLDARRGRALTRDGDLYRPHWDRWAAQEERHLLRDRPQELADVVVDIP